MPSQYQLKIPNSEELRYFPQTHHSLMQQIIHRQFK